MQPREAFSPTRRGDTVSYLAISNIRRSSETGRGCTLRFLKVTAKDRAGTTTETKGIDTLMTLRVELERGLFEIYFNGGTRSNTEVSWFIGRLLNDVTYLACRYAPVTRKLILISLRF